MSTDEVLKLRLDSQDADLREIKAALEKNREEDLREMENTHQATIALLKERYEDRIKILRMIVGAMGTVLMGIFLYVFIPAWFGAGHAR